MTTDTASSGAWAAEQLTAFVAALATQQAEDIVRVAIECAAEVLEAEIAALVVDGVVEGAIGFARGEVPHGLVVDLARTRPARTTLACLGDCDVLVVPFDAGTASSQLLVVRAGSGGWSLDERNLLRGMSRVLALSRQAKLSLAALEERQALLERLNRIQRSITSRTPLPDVLQAIVSGARELLGDTLVGFRRVSPDDPACADIICSAGITDGSPFARRIRVGQGAGGRAIAEERLVVIDGYAASPHALEQFAEHGLQTAMAAPVREDGVTIGSLVVASFDPDRRYSEAEQEILQSFADHASIAVTDARIVESLRQALHDARHDAMHDVLTSLPNRALLRDRLMQAAARASRHHSFVALIFVDLDGFKHVNDSLGHDVGDQLLVTVGARFTDAVRDSDTVARLGGDEFAVLMEDVESIDDVNEVAERLLKTLAEPVAVDGREVTISASVGIALSGVDTAGSQTLLRNADLAMYEAKRAGGGRFVRFAPDMHHHTVERLNTEQALRHAIADDQLVLHYQPIHDIVSGRIVAAEALVRWQHPSRGLIGPAEFIPVAESSRLITALGEWVLRAACTTAMTWPTDVRVTVNVSPRQVDPCFVNTVRSVLAETGLAPQRLTLEVTEGTAMADSPETLAVIEELHATGIHVAIDDFGTGYSSLARLRALPVDILKIDRSFITDLDDGHGDALISAIVALCRGSGLVAVAEGVETEAQLRRLQELGCAQAQGFLLARPMPADDLCLWLARGAVPRPARITAAAC